MRERDSDYPSASFNGAISTTATKGVVQTRCSHTGITVITDEMPDARTVSIGLYIRNGSANERTQEAGISHFLEHLVFKGPVSAGQEITEAMAELGSHVNAYTTDEHTSYYATALPDVAAATFELLLQLLHPKYSEADIEVERAVVLEEMKQYRDDPGYFAHEKGLRFFAPRHPLTKPIIGTEAALSKMDKAAIENFFFRRYRTDQIVVSIAGALAGIDIGGILARNAGHLRRGGDKSTRPEQLAVNYPSMTPRPGVQRLTRRGIHTTHLVGFWPGVSEHDPLKFALELWCDIVGAGSRFAWRLVEPGLVDAAGISCEPRLHSGYVMLSAEGSPERAKLIEAELGNILAELVVNPITADELDQSKAMIEFSLASRDETPVDRMTGHGEHWITHGVPYPLAAEQAGYRAVTLEQVNSFAGSYQLSGAALTVLGPTKR